MQSVAGVAPNRGRTMRAEGTPILPPPRSPSRSSLGRHTGGADRDEVGDNNNGSTPEFRGKLQRYEHNLEAAGRRVTRSHSEGDLESAEEGRVRPPAAVLGSRG